MKIGMIGGASRHGFEYVKSKGLSGIEFTINVGDNPMNYYNKKDELKEYSQEFGLEVSSIGHWGTERIHSDGKISQEDLEHSYALIELAQTVGCKNYVCGVNYVNKLSYDENIAVSVDYLKKVVAYGRERGVRIAVYNCRWNNYIVKDKEWEIVLGAVEDLGIKFDASHCIYDGGDYMSEMKKWAHKFYHVHLKGTLIIDGRHFDDPPVGLDQINWGVFMNLLYIRGYKDFVSLEPHSGYWRDELGQRGLDFSIRYIKQYLF